MNIIETK